MQIVACLMSESFIGNYCMQRTWWQVCAAAVCSSALVGVCCRLDLNMDLPQAQTTSVGVASQASQEQVCNTGLLFALLV